MIKKAFAKSWMDLKEHPKLFVPDFIYRIIIVGLSLYFASDFAVLTDLVNTGDIEALLNDSLSVVYVGLFFVVLQFLIGVAVESVRYGMINEIIKKKKSSLSLFKLYIKDYYFRILKLKILVGLIMLVAASFIFGIVLLLNFTVIKEYMFSIFIGLAGVFYILMSLALFFRYPAMVLNNRKALQSIFDSYNYFKKNVKHTLIAGIITSLVAGISLFGAGIPVVSIGINLLATVWISVFVFNSFNLKRKS